MVTSAPGESPRIRLRSAGPPFVGPSPGLPIRPCARPVRGQQCARTSERPPPMANLTLVQAITLGLQQEMEKDSRVVLLGEDVGLNGGVFRVTEGLQKQFGADRVIDTPLSESGIMGTAI